LKHLCQKEVYNKKISMSKGHKIKLSIFRTQSLRNCHRAGKDKNMTSNTMYPKWDPRTEKAH
jgi:hypothetical protein